MAPNCRRLQMMTSRSDQAYRGGMASRHILFRFFYRAGFHPWDGHPVVTPLRELIEGTADTSALPPGSALTSDAVPETRRSTSPNTDGKSPASTSYPRRST